LSIALLTARFKQISSTAAMSNSVE
jgi:hypothetical protein